MIQNILYQVTWKKTIINKKSSVLPPETSWKIGHRLLKRPLFFTYIFSLMKRSIYQWKYLTTSSWYIIIMRAQIGVFPILKPIPPPFFLSLFRLFWSIHYQFNDNDTIITFYGLDLLSFEGYYCKGWVALTKFCSKIVSTNKYFIGYSLCTCLEINLQLHKIFCCTK